MVSHIFAFVLAYIVVSGALMYANTVWFGLGDVKFGTEGWRIYWPLWCAFYSPVALAAIVVVYLSGLPPQKKASVLWVSLSAILVTLEVSFIFNDPTEL